MGALLRRYAWPGSPRAARVRYRAQVPAGRFERIDAEELQRRLAGARPPLLLDVRRGDAFTDPPGIPSAVAFPLDREPLRLPDLSREHPIAAYCL